MRNQYDSLIRMLRTEKGTNQSVMGKYSFLVAKDANKIDIKSAVEHIYKVKVESVNTMVNYGKRKRVRFELGKTPDWKKAVVTLKKGEKIEIA